MLETQNKDGFKELLETYLVKANVVVPKNPRILDIGCGFLTEGSDLFSHFGELSAITVVEKDDDKIPYLQKEHKIHVVHDDARNLKKIVDDLFDVVIIRNPNVQDFMDYGDAIFEDPWRNIFRKAYDVTKLNGICIGTAENKSEGKAVSEFMVHAGYDILVDEINPNARPCPAGPFSSDEFSDYMKFDHKVTIAAKRSKNVREALAHILRRTMPDNSFATKLVRNSYFTHVRKRMIGV